MNDKIAMIQKANDANQTVIKANFAKQLKAEENQRKYEEDQLKKSASLAKSEIQHKLDLEIKNKN